MSDFDPLNDSEPATGIPTFDPANSAPEPPAPTGPLTDGEVPGAGTWGPGGVEQTSTKKPPLLIIAIIAMILSAGGIIATFIDASANANADIPFDPGQFPSGMPSGFGDRTGMPWGDASNIPTDFPSGDFSGFPSGDFSGAPDGERGGRFPMGDMSGMPDGFSSGAPSMGMGNGRFPGGNRPTEVHVTTSMSLSTTQIVIVVGCALVFCLGLAYVIVWGVKNSKNTKDMTEHGDHEASDEQPE